LSCPPPPTRRHSGGLARPMTRNITSACLHAHRRPPGECAGRRTSLGNHLPGRQKEPGERRVLKLPLRLPGQFASMVQEVLQLTSQYRGRHGQPVALTAEPRRPSPKEASRPIRPPSCPRSLAARIPPSAAMRGRAGSPNRRSCRQASGRSGCCNVRLAMKQVLRAVVAQVRSRRVLRQPGRSRTHPGSKPRLSWLAWSECHSTGAGACIPSRVSPRVIPGAAIAQWVNHGPGMLVPARGTPTLGGRAPSRQASNTLTNWSLPPRGG